MTYMILGQDVIDNRSEFTDLPDEFFALIDPEGTCVIAEASKVKEGYKCLCLFKFITTSQAFEAVVTFSDDLFSRIVHPVDLTTLKEVH
jgi:hypothetical protein